MITLLSFPLAVIVVKIWQHWDRVNAVVCRLLAHPESELVIAPDRLYVKCRCGFESCGVSVPSRNA